MGCFCMSLSLGGYLLVQLPADDVADENECITSPSSS